MPDDAETVDVDPSQIAQGHEIPAEVRAAAEEAVKDAIGAQAMVPVDVHDRREGMIAMDAHDAARFVEGLVRQAQEANLGKRWIYELGSGQRTERGLTVDAVEDITQQMNWTGRCRISVVRDSLQVEVIEADEGDGPEPFWVATVGAIDEVTGDLRVGTAMEPQKLKLRATTANAKRQEGKAIPEDNRVFDRFSRAKAINKAERNAREKHIPEVVKVTLIAMAAKNPTLVERIRSEAEVKVEDLPPPLDTPEARALIEELGAIYDEIRTFGDGRGRVLLPPGQYNAYLVQSQHSMELLGRMKDWLVQRRQEIREELSK